MSTLAQIEALKSEVDQLSADLVEINSRSRLAKRSLQSVKRKSLYLRTAQALRKPAEQYELWNVGVLVLAPTMGAAIIAIFLNLLGMPTFMMLFLTIFTAFAVCIGSMLLLKVPATDSLPGLITDRANEAEQFKRETVQLNHESSNLRQKISVAQIAINELLESDRLRRTSILDQPWKTMRDVQWRQLVIEAFEILGASDETAQTSGDQGIDLLVRFGSMLIAVQTKGYVGSVGIEVVQQVIAGKNHYDCDRAAVITNSRFTAPARALAASNRCFLIGEQEFPAFVLGSNLELFK